jgi:hypothetical protein
VNLFNVERASYIYIYIYIYILRAWNYISIISRVSHYLRECTYYHAIELQSTTNLLSTCTHLTLPNRKRGPSLLLSLGCTSSFFQLRTLSTFLSCNFAFFSARSYFLCPTLAIQPCFISDVDDSINHTNMTLSVDFERTNEFLQLSHTKISLQTFNIFIFVTNRL